MEILFHQGTIIPELNKKKIKPEFKYEVQH